MIVDALQNLPTLLPQQFEAELICPTERAGVLTNLYQQKKNA